MNRETVLKRNEEKDILKGILILAVVIGHISATLSPPRIMMWLFYIVTHGICIVL